MSLSVHPGGAPASPSRLSSVDPLSTGVVSLSFKDEWELTRALDLAAGGTEFVEPGDVFSVAVHPGGAPRGPCRLSSVVPLSTGVVNLSLKDERELAGVRR